MNGLGQLEPLRAKLAFYPHLAHPAANFTLDIVLFCVAYIALLGMIIGRQFGLPSRRYLKAHPQFAAERWMARFGITMGFLAYFPFLGITAFLVIGITGVF